MTTYTTTTNTTWFSTFQKQKNLLSVKLVQKFRLKGHNKNFEHRCDTKKKKRQKVREQNRQKM